MDHNSIVSQISPGPVLTEITQDVALAMPAPLCMIRSPMYQQSLNHVILLLPACRYNPAMAATLHLPR